MTRMKQILVAVIAAAALIIALTNPFGLPQGQAPTLAIVMVVLSLWSTGVVAPFLASLLFFTVVLIGGLATPDVVFGGFTAPVMWLIVSGFVIGESIRRSGLGDRLAAGIGPHLSRSYAILLLGLTFIGMVLGFLMPSSMGRAVVLVPVGMALAESLGFEKGSNGRVGVALAIAFATHMPSFAVLPSNIPNIILSGGAASIYGVEFGYGEYLALHYPVLGLLKSLVTVALILRFFPAEARAIAKGANGRDLGHGGRQLWLMAVLLVTLGFWVTDGLHGVQAAWIGLAASVVLLLPKIGFLDGKAFKEANDFGMLVFVAGALGLGGVVASTGLGDQLARGLATALPLAEGRDFVNFLSLAGLGMVTNIFTTIPGVPAVLTPLAGELAQMSGLSIKSVLMTQVLGFSMIVFPYQSGPLIVAMGLTGESLKPLLKMTVSLALVTLIVLVPLDFLWWQMLGWI